MPTTPAGDQRGETFAKTFLHSGRTHRKRQQVKIRELMNARILAQAISRPKYQIRNGREISAITQRVCECDHSGLPLKPSHTVNGWLRLQDRLELECGEVASYNEVSDVSLRTDQLGHSKVHGCPGLKSHGDTDKSGTIAPNKIQYATKIHLGGTRCYGNLMAVLRKGCCKVTKCEVFLNLRPDEDNPCFIADHNHSPVVTMSRIPNRAGRFHRTATH